MKGKNLLRLGFMSLFCLLGTFAWAIDDVTVSDVVTCYFTGGAASNTTNFRFDSDSYTTNSGHGTASINGETYTDCLKVGGSTKVKFTTLSANTELTIVVTDEDVTQSHSNIKVTPDGEDAETLTLSDGGNVFTYTCATAGEYTISRGDAENHVVYIGLSAECAEYEELVYDAVTVSDDIECWFTDGAPTNTDYFTFSMTDGSDVGYSTSGHGSVVINDETISACLKMETNTQVSFTTSVDGAILTLVFGESETTPNIKIDGEKQEGESNVMTFTLAAGDHTITKADGHYIFYMGVSGDNANGEIEGDVTEGDGTESEEGEVVEQCLYTTDFTEWDASETTHEVTTDYSSESLVFTLVNSDVEPTDVSNTEKFGDYEGCLRINTDKKGSDEVTTSALNSITKVEVDYGTTASGRGLYVYSKGDSDSDWVLTYDGSGSTQGSHPVTIDVNKENCELKFVSAVDDQYVFLISLAIYGNVESVATGINNAAIVSSNVANGAIYNLAGQRLSKLTKGINIVNGKKIFVK